MVTSRVLCVRDLIIHVILLLLGGCLLLGCQGDYAGAEPRPGLEAVLSLQYEGHSLGALLSQSDKSIRGVGTCVLAFRTLLHEEGGRWMVRAIEAGKAPSRHAGWRLLASDLGAAELATTTLRDWLEKEDDEREKVQIALLLFETGDGSEDVRACLQEALRSRDRQIAYKVIGWFGGNEGLVDGFVDDMMNYVEAHKDDPIPGASLGVGALQALLKARVLPEGVIDRLASLACEDSNYSVDLILEILGKQGCRARRALPTVLKLAESQYAEERAALCRFLAVIGDRSDPVGAVLERLSKDPEAKVRLAANEGMRILKEGLKPRQLEMWPEEPRGVSQVLNREYRGRTLRSLLRRSEISLRGLSEAVLGFRSALGMEGSRWLARVVKVGIPPDEKTRLRLLGLDLKSASLAVPFLLDWMASEHDAERRLQIASLILQTGAECESAISVLKHGLKSENPLLASLYLGMCPHISTLLAHDVLKLIDERGPEWIYTEVLLRCLAGARCLTKKDLFHLAGFLKRPQYPRTAVLAAIAGQGPAAVPLLADVASLSESPDAKLRVAVARSLGRIGVLNQMVVATLAKLGADRVESVRFAARQALRELRGDQK